MFPRFRASDGILLSVLVLSVGCTYTPPDPIPSKAFVEAQTPNKAVVLPDGVGRNAKRGRTYVYWNLVAREFAPCIASETKKPDNVYTDYVQKEVLGNIRAIPVKGVDEEAVNAISLLINVSAGDTDINAKNTQQAVSSGFCDRRKCCCWHKHF
jgi:hypothetical protein